MGVVVAAHHLQLDERVAIKFLAASMLGRVDAVARFAREARAAVKIKSEHVARVSDVGTLDNGAPYMVMEYLDGLDLHAWIQREGPLSVEQAAEFVLQACEAIAEAHALGIVHRDIKPSNLFLVNLPDGSPSIKVLDFGISKITGAGSLSADDALTQTAALMGSPLYMSPEQVRSSRDVDTRTDIWSLGVILYELVAGHSPFTAESMPKLIYKIISDGPRPLRDFCPHAPPGFEDIILKCLEKDADARFQSVGELALSLIDFAPRRSRRSVERISGVMKAAGLAGGESSGRLAFDRTEVSANSTAWGRTTPGAVGGPIALLLLSILVVACGVGAFFYFKRTAAVDASSRSVSSPVPDTAFPVGAEPSAAGLPVATAADPRGAASVTVPSVGGPVTPSGSSTALPAKRIAPHPDTPLRDRAGEPSEAKGAVAPPNRSPANPSNDVYDDRK